MSMSKLRFLLLFGLISIFTLVSSAASEQQPPPIAGLGYPSIQWYMPPDQFQQNAPGEFQGQIYVQNQQFFGYEAIGQYYFDPHRLIWINITPAYRKEQSTEWTPEYQYIRQQMTELYGTPNKTDPYQWSDQYTAATFLMLNNGWWIRFDPYIVSQEE